MTAPRVSSWLGLEVGSDGAGHYVKMVHNGIEYGDMQLIAEAYALLHKGAGLSHETLAATFAAWNKTELDSFLIEITANILAFKDEDGQPLLTKIRDSAGQKGTGTKQFPVIISEHAKFRYPDEL